MKKKLQTVLQTIPFCIPFAYLLLHSDYFHTEWIRNAAIPLLMGFAIICGISGKLLPMLAGSATGGAISVVITALTNSGFDEGWFKPLTSVTYTILLAVFVYIIQLAEAAGTKAILKAVEKKYGENKKIRKITLTVVLTLVIAVALYSAGYTIGHLWAESEKSGTEYEYTVNQDEFVSVETVTLEGYETERVSLS